MAEQEQLRKKRTFRKFTYRGVDLDQLLDLTHDQLTDLVHARARRRFSRGLKKKSINFMRRLRKAKKEVKPLEKPEEFMNYFTITTIKSVSQQSVFEVAGT